MNNLSNGSGGQLSPSLRPHNPATGFWPLGNSGLYWTVFARNRDTAVPTEGNGDLQTLICVLVARLRRCPTLSNPVPWQSWMTAYPGCSQQMKTLFPSWPMMVHDAHTRRRRLLVAVVRDFVGQRHEPQLCSAKTLTDWKLQPWRPADWLVTQTRCKALKCIDAETRSLHMLLIVLVQCRVQLAFINISFYTNHISLSLGCGNLLSGSLMIYSQPETLSLPWRAVPCHQFRMCWLLSRRPCHPQTTSGQLCAVSLAWRRYMYKKNRLHG